MITVLLCALLCGFCTVFMVATIAQTHKKWTIALMVLTPVFSLGLYLLLGAPVF